MHITNNLLSMILAIAAGSPDTLVIAAPIPEQAVVAVRNIVEGLPTCATPTMRSMVFRAPEFGCEDTATGMPDVACLCSSRTFKKMAKSGVRSDCSDPADIGAAREWAISRCTAALTAAQFEKREEPGAVSRVPAIALAAAGTTTPSAITSMKNAGKLLSQAPIVRPPDGMSVATASDAAVRGGILAVTKGYAGTLFDLDDDEDETSAALGKRYKVLRLSLAIGVVGVFLLS